MQELWQRALSRTEIRRARVQNLATFSDTHVSYIVLSESSFHSSDTVVRKGEVIVEKPSLILPPNIPQFLGFEFQKDGHVKDADLINFLLVRGINLPSLKYNNKVYSLNVEEKGLEDAARHYLDELQQKEDVHTGLMTGPDDCWQFSLLIFICSQVAKNAQTDIQKLFNEYRKFGS